MHFFRIRFAELCEAYDGGRITQMECLTAMLAALTIAITKLADRTEEVLFTQTNKRPHEHGL
jgi:hypothetical protein